MMGVLGYQAGIAFVIYSPLIGRLENIEGWNLRLIFCFFAC
jgi:hypothetical protein